MHLAKIWKLIVKCELSFKNKVDGVKQLEVGYLNIYVSGGYV